MTCDKLVSEPSVTEGPAGTQGERGFILVATLWVIAVITLVVGYYVSWVSDLRDDFIAKSERIDATLDVASTRATALYLLATRQRDVEGLKLPQGFIRMDGTPYKGIGQARFAIHDLSGFVNLNAQSGVQQRNLLVELGLSRSRAEAAVAKLLDYTDPDDQLRPNGAEAAAYRHRQEPPPTNRLLVGPLEVLRVQGWKDLLSPEQLGALRDHSTVYGTVRTNLNAATGRVLRTLPWLRDSQVDRALKAREERLFRSLQDFQERLALDPQLEIDPLMYTVVPSPFVRLSVWSAGGAWERRSDLRLTPHSEQGAPWIMDQTLKTPHPQWRTHEAMAPPGPLDQEAASKTATE
jgi:type II secretory pathway component PulK